jgi:hypothetical protein
MNKTTSRFLFVQSRIAAVVILSLLIVFCLIRSVTAQSVTAEGFDSDQTLQRGMIVSLKAKKSTKVEPVTPANSGLMHGVVVNPNDAPVTLSRDGQKTFVAAVGQYEVLVSTQNGQISPGDYVVPSSLGGIGMKADKIQQYTIGKAMVAFTGQQGSLSQASIKSSDGSTRQVAIGRVMVDIGIGHNPLQSNDNGVPAVLGKIASSVSHKQVSPMRIYIGTVVFVITAIVAGVMLYSGIRSGLISVGRNPLSKKSIFRGLAQVVISSLIVFIIGLFGVYLLLKL